MGKGGSNEIKETEAQKAAADVASEQWSLYKNDLQQYEDLFMDKVDNLNSEGEYDKLAGAAALGTAQSFGEVRAGMADSLAAGGVDPTSGKYQSAMSNLESDQALSQTDTTNRAQSSQQDRYVAGLKDVVSIGAGQKAEALAGMGDVASTSLRKATSDAQLSFQDKQATAGLVGTLAGGATAYGLGQLKPPVQVASKKISPTASVLQNQGY
ncbi:hypothetical protein J4G66_03170 [Aeromonas dhakensis]|uniref:hypothetical protein n=1 Tax=Aeromonas dhakensis TaxID=196024 RepID=UPI001B3A0B0F|nr:hypothetical protein [Aeromonas dhakensis]MBQ4672864.1 hypothetical protein [Aeromonas dhakensis]MBS4714976.1 hypothetical protein [Aeromonas dhakensis]